MNIRARRFAAQWDQPWFGFWDSEAAVLGRPFALEDHADAEWRPHDRDAIIAYLRSSPTALVGQVPPEPCGLCGGLFHPALFLSDGQALWTDNVAHLVERHDFLVPDRMVRTIRGRNYVPPDGLDDDMVERLWPPNG